MQTMCSKYNLHEPIEISVWTTQVPQTKALYGTNSQNIVSGNFCDDPGEMFTRKQPQTQFTLMEECQEESLFWGPKTQPDITSLLEFAQRLTNAERDLVVF